MIVKRSYKRGKRDIAIIWNAILQGDDIFESLADHHCSRFCNLRQIHEDLFLRKSHSCNEVVVHAFPVPPCEGQIAFHKLVARMTKDFYNLHHHSPARRFEIEDLQYPSGWMDFKSSYTSFIHIVWESAVVPFT